jgi:hypothetical protein
LPDSVEVLTASFIQEDSAIWSLAFVVVVPANMRRQLKKMMYFIDLYPFLFVEIRINFK